MKKFLAIIMAVVLCVGLLGGYVWYRNIYIYQPKDLTVELADKDVTAEFVGTRRMVEHLTGEIRLNGRLYIDEDWYPIYIMRTEPIMERPESIGTPTKLQYTVWRGKRNQWKKARKCWSWKNHKMSNHSKSRCIHTAFCVWRQIHVVGAEGIA